MKTAVRQLTFNKVDNATEYIDLGECLSQVNRQAYRQGYVYLVESFAWQHVAGLEVQMRTLPTSWTVYQSWKKAKRIWDKMNREAVRGLGKGAYPAYHDFKAFFNSNQYESYSGVDSNLLPVDGDRNLFSNVGREWTYSQYVSAAAGGSGGAYENCCHMLGDDSAVANGSLATNGSVAIIQGYGDTRITVGLEEPELPADAPGSWQVAIFDDGETDSDIIQHLELFNDQPPYAHALDAQGGDNPIYVGGSETGQSGHRIVTMSPMAGETIYAPGGEIPLGLIEVRGGGEGDFGLLTINLAPGAYQGIAALPMGKVST
jgi:hypothetical protein